MKKKQFRLILAILLAMMSLLAACSEGSDNSPSAESADSPPDNSSSIPTETKPDASDMVSFNEDTPPHDEDDVEAVELEMVRIDADGGLRMRGGPGTDYAIIKTIPQNSYVEVATGEDDDPHWLYVFYDGDFGWVSKEFISDELEYSSASWAKVYHDYLSTFEPVEYTSTMYGSTHTVAGRMVDGEKIACAAIEFHRLDGYAYPVLTCWDGTAIDADGYMDGPMFVPNVYLVEHDTLTTINPSDPRWQDFMISDGYPEPKGSFVAEFSFKPENGGDPQNTKEALAWLETQM